MASKRAAVPAKHLFNGFKASQTRSMATEAPLPQGTYANANLSSTSPQESTRPANPFLKTAQCTLYSFPSLSPSGFTTYPSTHLLVPLRRDILHKAVIFEGDAARSGTASTKHRSEVHGSNRKIRPQKGSGRARLGDKKSPMLRGGGVAHGPKPRDFSTELPRKIYDLAWRTALSYRWKMGELTIIDGEAEIQDIEVGSLARYTKELLRWNHMGKTLFVTGDRRENLYSALEMDGMDTKARAIEDEWVDVKDLLETPKIVIERESLRRIMREHESDLAPTEKLRAWEASRSIEGGSGGVLHFA